MVQDKKYFLGKISLDHGNVTCKHARCYFVQWC